MPYDRAVLVFVRRLVPALVLTLLAAVAWVASDSTGIDVVPLKVSAASSPSTLNSRPVVSTAQVSDALLDGVRQDDVARRQALTSAALLAASDATPSLPACAVIRQDGTDVLAVGKDRSLPPGFTQSFVTGYAALELLGADFTFVTRLVTDPPPSADGVLTGDLVLIGGGDPVLATSSFAAERPGRVWTAFDDLADAVSASEIGRITKPLVVDEGRYDAQRSIPGWSPSSTVAEQIGALGALQLDDGVTENQDISPATSAGQRLVTLLGSASIEVPAVVETAENADDEQAPPDEAFEVGRVASAPLRDIVKDMWTNADATTAEMLLKELGADDLVAGRNRSSAAGGKSVQQQVRALGVDLALSPRDGSGLDPTARVTCDMLVTILDRVPPEHPALALMAAPDAPAFGGQFDQLASTDSIRLVGGTVGSQRGVVGLIADGPNSVTFASLVDGTDELSAAESIFQTRVIEAAVLLATDEGQ